MRTWLTVAEGAEYADVSRDTIYTACERRELSHARLNGRRAIRLRREWIDRWLERHLRGAHSVINAIGTPTRNSECRDHTGERVDLATLVEDPAKVASVPPTRIPALLSQLSAIQSAIAARLIAAERNEPASSEDTLLTVVQAAERLGVSKDWLFQRSRTLPFVVRLGRHLRFSSRGIDHYLRNRTGR